jgi:hypothetical protein
VSKIASIKNVQNNVQKHSIKNGVLKSVEYFVGNKLSKRMSKWYQYKCQKPSCWKKCQNGVKRNVKHFSVENISKKESKSTPCFGSEGADCSIICSL